jgi:hypothetical protein
MRITYAMIREKMQGVPYTMELTGEDAELVEKVVNQGIDAHLEACFLQDIDQYTWETRTIRGIPVVKMLDCRVSVKSLPVLLRRLYDLTDEAEGAEDLCMSILDTLGFEDLGTSGFEIISPVDEHTNEDGDT